MAENLYGFPQPLTPLLPANPKARFPNTPYVVGPLGSAGYQTIQTAINAAHLAGGGAVFIQPGIYHENLQLRVGVSLTGIEGNVDSNHIQIHGIHTPDPSNGTMTFTRINFYGVDQIFYSSAAGQGYMAFDFCNWSLSGSGYIFDLPNWIGPTGLITGPFGVGGINSGDLSTGTSGFLRNTAGMYWSFDNCFIGSAFGGSPLPIISSGNVLLTLCDLTIPIQMTGTATTMYIEYCAWHGQGITLGGATGGTITHCAFTALTDPAITMSSSANWTISDTNIDTSNDPAIDGSGAGTLTLTGINFLNNANVAGTLTTNYGTTTSGNFQVNKKINIATGAANSSIGTSSALSSGSVAVATTAVTASSKIILSHATAAGTEGHLSVGAINPGVSFAIISNGASDTSTVNWWIVN
jgi:hypothetical protein